VEEFGPSWKRIAIFFPSRTDINITSRWRMLQRRLQKQVLFPLANVSLPEPAPFRVPLAEPFPFIVPVPHTQAGSAVREDTADQ
jgi:hypothetical protein